ncbi:MAG: hypothetical protein AAB447_02970 [Patescibacteria group bacterium]
MIWGIIGLFVMVAVWGLVALIGGTFGIRFLERPQTPQLRGTGFTPTQSYLQQLFNSQAP